ncbi:MAG TPA: hypothetical protein VF450_25525 [Noviherbaspirillum sp.]|jgi:hypothetical protein
MKWFYEWRLKRVCAEIAALEETTKVKLVDDYTGHSRLRVLRRMQESLQRKLSKQTSAPRKDPVSEVKEIQEAH